MGGKALTVETRRYEKDEYFKLVDEVLPMVKEAFGATVTVVQAFHNKPSFGDMDILVMKTADNMAFTRQEEIIIETFEPRDTFYNGNVWSFDYKEFQIDLIFIKEVDWESAQAFFSWNDLGNLMGKMYHKFGLKYGHAGVNFPYRMDGKSLGNISVTKDPKQAIEFLGLSYERFQEGFDNIEDVFDYIIASPYFVPETFYMENLNAIDRKRNKKRVNYQGFIEYVNGTGQYSDRLPLTSNTAIKFNPDKTVYWDQINDFFPKADFNHHMARLQEKEKIKRIIAEKFNGNIVMDLTGISGKELGSFIGKFKQEKKQHVGAQLASFDKYVLNNDVEKIKEDIKDEFVKFKADI